MDKDYREVETFSLYRGDDEGLCAVYAKGHLDPVFFAEAVNYHWGLEATAGTARHVYLRHIPITHGDFGRITIEADKPGRGAFAATIYRLEEAQE